MSFITYIKENSDLLNDDDDKNPLFYLPVIIKVSAGKTTEELKDDYQLKSLLNQIEKLKKIDSELIGEIDKLQKKCSHTIKSGILRNYCSICEKYLIDIKYDGENYIWLPNTSIQS